MSEEIGPQTKAAIKQMRWAPDPGSAWGRRSLLTLPIGFGIIILVLIAISASGLSSSGYGLIFFVPILYGVPIVSAVGIFFSVVGFYRDAERTLASIGLAIWSVLGIGVVYFLMKMFSIVK